MPTPKAERAHPNPTVESRAGIDPQLIIMETPEGVDYTAAFLIGSYLKTNPYLTMTLPTGNTPIGMYERLVRMHQEEGYSFRGTKIFNLDEYWKISPDNPASFASFMRRRLIEHIDIETWNWHIPNGAADNPVEEAQRYAQLLAEIGRVDVAVLGIGAKTCHLGFNEPGTSIHSRTHFTALTPETREANNKPFIQNGGITPHNAITQGLVEILGAKVKILLAKGEEKAEAVKRALHGPITEAVPASLLRKTNGVIVIVDKSAASLLR